MEDLQAGLLMQLRAGYVGIELYPGEASEPGWMCHPMSKQTNYYAAQEVLI